MKKRLCAVLLAMAMLVSMLSMSAWADTTDADSGEEETVLSSASFFKWLYDEKGYTDAYDAYLLLTTGTYGSVDITSSKDGEFFAATELGVEGDATTMDNLEATIQWLRIPSFLTAR